MNAFRFLRCLFHVCPCRTNHDDKGVWGECVDCGKRFGFMSHEELRGKFREDLKTLVSPKGSDTPDLPQKEGPWIVDEN